MQAATISYGKETTAVALDDDEDEDDEGGGGGGEVGQESRTEDSELKKPGQVHTVSMDVQQHAAPGELRLGLPKVDSLFFFLTGDTRITQLTHDLLHHLVNASIF